jgi:hypothetical protein
LSCKDFVELFAHQSESVELSLIMLIVFDIVPIPVAYLCCLNVSEHLSPELCCE